MYTAIKNAQGNYEISQGGNRIATGSASALQNYGLSETQLSTPTPTASNPTPAQPTALGNQVATTQQAQNAAQPQQPKPSLSGSGYYTGITQQIQNGTLSGQDAINKVNSLISSGNYSDTAINLNQLFTGSMPKGTTYTNAQGQTITYDSTGSPQVSPSTQISSIPTTVTQPTQNSTGLTLPTGNAGQSVSDYTTSVANTLASQQEQLSQISQVKTADYQSKIDAANQQANDAKQMAESGLVAENSTIAQESAQNVQALQLEQQQYTENYNAIKSLAGQATALVATASALTDQMRNTTGLASIMNPRISQTAADLTAQLAVIQGAVSIYSGQIGHAQNQLKSATDTISSIYSDQINYYQSVVNFYTDQQKVANAQVVSLSSDQKTYINAQIKQLSDKVADTQVTADYISKAMIDPATAVVFAQAGVTLNMTVPQVNAALDTAQQSKTISDFNDSMIKSGYSLTPIAGAKSEKITDQYGKSWYHSITTAQSSGNGGGSGTQFTSTQFTSTQLNKGSVNAGVSIADFNGYDIDTKNYFINNESAIKTVKDQINSAQSTGKYNGSTADASTIKAAINSSSAPQAVKDMLNSYTDSKFPAETSSNGSGFEWYNPLTWFTK